MSSKPAGAPLSPGIPYETEGCPFGAWRNIVVAIWNTQGTGPLAAELARVTEPFAKAHPEGFSNLHVIGKSPPPNSSKCVSLRRRVG